MINLRIKTFHASSNNFLYYSSCDIFLVMVKYPISSLPWVYIIIFSQPFILYVCTYIFKKCASVPSFYTSVDWGRIPFVDITVGILFFETNWVRFNNAADLIFLISKRIFFYRTFFFYKKSNIWFSRFAVGLSPWHWR